MTYLKNNRKNMVKMTESLDYFSHSNCTRFRFFPATASSTTSGRSTPELRILCNFQFFVLFHLVCVPSK